MPQHDIDIANQVFPALRTDINAALLALATNSSGASAPATTYAYQPWADTTAGVLKIRNAANSAWVSVINLTNGMPVAIATNDISTTGRLTTNSIKEDASGNVGIGTASPTSVLHLKAATNPVIRMEGASDSGYVDYNGTRLQLSAGGGDIYLAAGNAERFRLTASGNAGLGVVPSAWIGGYSVFEFGRAGHALWAAKSGANNTLLTQNAYYDGSFRYGYTAAAAHYEMQNGLHKFFSAPSGTAGNAITFTQSLAVGLGTTLALEGATSAAGTGIAFPATQLASSNANTLDDYEEGIWTPTLTFGGGSTGMTYSSQSCSYVKKGIEVTITGQLLLSAKGSSTGDAIISGLPFVVANNNNAYTGSGSRLFNTSFSGVYHIVALIGTSTMAVGQDTDTGFPSNLTHANFTNTSGIYFMHTYFV